MGGKGQKSRLLGVLTPVSFAVTSPTIPYFIAFRGESPRMARQTVRASCGTVHSQYVRWLRGRGSSMLAAGEHSARTLTHPLASPLCLCSSRWQRMWKGGRPSSSV